MSIQAEEFPPECTQSFPFQSQRMAAPTRHKGTLCSKKATL